MTERTSLSSRIARILIVALLVSSTAAVAVGGVSAQQAGSETAAELVVEQPHYISEEVDQTRDNGTTMYSARGSELKLYPQNFESDNVINYGIENGNATLGFERQTGAFTLKPEGQGTYNLFFVVEKEVQKQNATSNETTTVTEQQRYTTRVRVTGGTDLIHRDPGDIQEMRQDAANWREFNATLQQEGLIGGAGIEATLQEMINWYDLKKNPQEALTGNVVAYLIIGTTSTAILVWIAFLGGHAKIVRALRKRLHIFEAVEEDEGGAKEAIAEMEHLQNQQNAQNQSWQDLDGFDDHIAGAFEEIFGPTVHDGAVEFFAAIQPRNIVSDRLQAMGQEGYVAVVDESVAPDGGNASPSIQSVRIVKRDDVGDAPEDCIIDLKEADAEDIEDIVDALEWWDADVIWKDFDAVEAEFDAHEMDVTYESMDLDSLSEQLQADMRHFRNEEAFGEYLREFLESIEGSRFCDEDGSPDEIRYAMTHFLKLSQLLDDKFSWPAVSIYGEHVDRALLDFDPEAQAREVVDSVQRGGAS